MKIRKAEWMELLNKGLFTYHRVLGRKIMGSFDREELQVGESPEEVVRLALMSRYFLAQVQAFLPQGPGILKCANWHVSNLLREAYLFSRSPKRDLFVYLKSFHEAHHSLANLMVGLGLLK